MGLTIYYNGVLNSEDSLPELIEVVKEVAEAHSWKYSTFKKKFPEKSFSKKGFDDSVYGICFRPDGCEPVCLSFLSNGHLTSPWMFDFYMEKGEKENISTGLAVKTQYAGAEVHKIIILFLDYLSKKYFCEFTLIDESRYWETRDEKELHKNFNYLNNLIDSFASTLKSTKKRKGETLEELIIRAATKVQSKRKIVNRKYKNRK